jgi:hypothetical protein
MSPAHRNHPWLVHAARHGKAQLSITLAEPGMPSIRSWLPVPQLAAAVKTTAPLRNAKRLNSGTREREGNET